VARPPLGQQRHRRPRRRGFLVPRRLQLDHGTETQITEEIDRLGETRHRFAAKGWIEPTARVQSPKIGEAPGRRRAATVGRSIKQIVVQEDDLPVGGEANVELDPPRAETGRLAKAGQGVFRGGRRGAAMADDERLRRCRPTGPSPARRRKSGRRQPAGAFAAGSSSRRPLMSSPVA
jgi:hypothetical protein